MNTFQAAAGSQTDPASLIDQDPPVWPLISSSDSNAYPYHSEEQPVSLLLLPGSYLPRKRPVCEANDFPATTIPPKRRRIEDFDFGNTYDHVPPANPSSLALPPAQRYNMDSHDSSIVHGSPLEAPDSSLRGTMTLWEPMTAVDLTSVPLSLYSHARTLYDPVAPTDDLTMIAGIEQLDETQPSMCHANSMAPVAGSRSLIQDNTACIRPNGLFGTNLYYHLSADLAGSPDQPVDQYGCSLGIAYTAPKMRGDVGLPTVPANPLYSMEQYPAPITDDILNDSMMTESVDGSLPTLSITPECSSSSAVSGMLLTNPCDMVATALAVPLMEHQRQGLHWMRSMEASYRRGGILADDMGLGKTVQALSLIVSHPSRDVERHATLVITPAGLVQQWKHEIQQLLRPHLHQCHVYVHYGDNRGKSFSTLNQYDIVLTSFGTITAELRRRDQQQGERGCSPSTSDLPLLGSTSRWHRVILDEAQCIKNDRSKAAAACCAVDATYRWCLSGTPMMNSLPELYSLLKFLRVQPSSDLDISTMASIPPLQSSWEPLQVRRIAHLRGLMNTMMLRRTKSSIIQGLPIIQLPAKTTENVYVSFTEQERKLYTMLESHSRLLFNRHLNGGISGRNKSRMMGLLQRLRQACCHPFLVCDFALAVLQSPESRERREGNAGCFAPAVIARLRSNESILECPICYENDVDNPVIFYPCGHSVCVGCFTKICRAPSSTRREAGGDGQMLCPSCRGIVDPAKATDYISFAKIYSLVCPETGESENLLRYLGKLFDRFENSCEGDNEGGSSATCASDGSNNSSGNFAEAWNSDWDGPLGLSLPVEFRMVPEPLSVASKQSWALLRKQALTNPAMRRKYQRLLDEKWITSSKMDKALEIMRGIQARGESSGEREKIILFSQFTSMLDLIEIPLTRNGWVYRRYDGTMKPADRHLSTVEFTTDPDCLILLVSLKAGNAGLNLTAASQVIILDPFWNPYVEEQAIGRVHRIGQRRPVHVHRILVPDTVEDRILDFQDRKRRLIKNILDDRIDVKPLKLKNNDFAYLFGMP
ncbi:DEAD/DEAH box helicase [Aspergillus affinis]|uniref:DEAD/DEAH box helicase n=1 Tax=Aspergillus affinis TaxID=1070780 RepID=UPI0022FEDEFA|nr:SNF2 family N-terminal domain-containing protein [Aspergillus affinis]KAI9041053.1 SNF2 family N-terminal domain-containing protein [Aspergillus affinis]